MRFLMLWPFVSGGGFGQVLVGLRVFPIVILGGLDSIVGTIASYLVLVTMLFVRPHGLFGRVDVARV